MTGGEQAFITLTTQADQFRLLGFGAVTTNRVQLYAKNLDKYFTSATTIPMQIWFCYEWHVTTNATSVYVDGNPVTDLSLSWTVSNAQSLQLGFQRFSSGTAAGDLWIDDVAVNATRVGCQ